MTDRKQDAPERGRRGWFDAQSGEVDGSGSDAGGKGNADEDYDDDVASGSGADPAPKNRHQGNEG